MNIKLLLCKWGLHKWTRPNTTWTHTKENAKMEIHCRYCQKCEKVQEQIIYYMKFYPPVYQGWLDIKIVKDRN